MPGTASFVSLCSAFRIISEVKPTEVIASVIKRVKATADENSEIWKEFSLESKTLQFIETSQYLTMTHAVPVLM